MATSKLGGTRVLGYGQQGPGQAAAQLLGQRLAGFGPAAPPPQQGGQMAPTTASGVVAELMLDRRASQLFLEAIDGWLRGGAQVPFQPPLPLPPADGVALQRRLAALAQQGSPYLAVPDLQTATPPRLLPGAGVVTQTPGRDQLAKQVLDRATFRRQRQGFGKGQDSLTPPKAVQAACKRGLDLAPEHGGDGLTQAAIGRARQMAAGQPVSRATLQRIKNFHSRHSSYEKEANPPSPGYVAQQLWGGPAGQDWAAAHADTDATAEKAAKWERQGWVGPGGAWATAKRKARAAGKDDAYASAIYRKMVGKSGTALGVLALCLAKAGGAGSRGGHIIGTTASGRAIYAPNHEKYHATHAALQGGGMAEHRDADAVRAVDAAHPGYSRQDHTDASEAHQFAAASTHRSDPVRAAHHRASQAHAAAAMRLTFKPGGRPAKPAFSDQTLSPTEKAMNRRTALALLNNHLSKGSGAGSRGGKILGYYRSGKPIYASGMRSNPHGGPSAHPANQSGLGKDITIEDNGGLSMAGHEKAIKDLHEKHFSDHTAQDHSDAAEAHMGKLNRMMEVDDDEPGVKGGMQDQPKRFTNHIQARNFHEAAAHVLNGKTAREGHGSL